MPRGRGRASHIARFLWALSLPAALLAWAVWRVWVPVREAWPALQEWPLVAALIPWVLVMAYVEGYRGFQRRVVPMLVERADTPAGGADSAPLQLPVAAAGLGWAPPALMRRRWILLAALATLANAVRLVPQLWRGLLDAGVLSGLGWGLAALLLQAFVGATGPNAVVTSPGPPRKQSHLH